MDKQQQRVLAAYRRGRWYLKKHEQVIGSETVAAAIAELDGAIAAMVADGAEKVRATERAKSSTAAKQELRVRLRDVIGPVAAIGEGGKVNAPESELAKFRWPSASLSDVALIAAARAMALSAADFKEVFLQYGQPEDFIEQIQAAAMALENRIIRRDGEQLNRRRARLGIGLSAAEARVPLRYISRVVVQKLRHRPDMVAAWRTAIRIGRLSGARAGAATVSTPAPTSSVLVADQERTAA